MNNNTIKSIFFRSKSFLLFVLILIFLNIFSFSVNAAFEICNPFNDADGKEYQSYCPYMSWRYPAHMATGVSTTDTMTITFTDSSTVAGTGFITIVNNNGPVEQTIACASMTKVGSTFSAVMSLSSDADVHVLMDSNCVIPAVTISDSNTWGFSTRPSVGFSSDPADGETNVCYTRGLTLNFNQPMYSDQNAAGGTFAVSCGGTNIFTEICGPSTFSGSGTNTLSKSIVYSQSSSCRVIINNNCIHNAGDTYWEGMDISFTTSGINCAGGSCLVIDLDPDDDAMNVRVDVDPTIEFDTIWYHDTYNPATATIHRSSDSSIVQSYNLTDPEISGVNTNRLTIKPALDLPASTPLYINFSGVPRVNCSPYIINDDTTWNFTTGDPLPIMLMARTPKTKRKNVNIDTYLEFQFDNPVFRGSGDIRVYRASDDALIETINSSSADIYGIGTTLIRVFPVDGLIYNENYYVTVDEGFFNGGSPANASAAIEAGEWYWRTRRQAEEPFWSDWF